MSSFIKIDKPSRTRLPASPEQSTPRKSISISPPPTPPGISADGFTYAAAASRFTVPPISSARQLVLKKLQTSQHLLSKSLMDFKFNRSSKRTKIEIDHRIMFAEASLNWDTKKEPENEILDKIKAIEIDAKYSRFLITSFVIHNLKVKGPSTTTFSSP